MGLFNVEVSISNFERPERRITLDALVNENKFFSILPLSMLRDLEVNPLWAAEHSLCGRRREEHEYRAGAGSD